jgi:hypothetical protein
MLLRKFHFVLSILSLLTIYSCKEKNISKSDFEFTYSDLNDRYDSQTGIFTRTYADDTINVKVELTENEKLQILKIFQDNDFENMPNEINCSEWGVHPTMYYNLSLNNLKVRYIKTSGDHWFCFNGKKVEKINAIIQSIILNKAEIKTLEDSNIFYE